MEVLGVMLAVRGSTEASMSHREEIAENVFFALQKSLTRKGNAQQKLRTWSTVVTAIMTHGCRTWHLTRDLIHRARA